MIKFVLLKISQIVNWSANIFKGYFHILGRTINSNENYDPEFINRVSSEKN